jgi:hypothetical protein
MCLSYLLRRKLQGLKNAMQARREAGVPSLMTNWRSANKKLLDALSLKKRTERQRELAERQEMARCDWESFLLGDEWRGEKQQALCDEIEREFIVHRPYASIHS